MVEPYIMGAMMSHPVNDELKCKVEDMVNDMSCLKLLNYCDEVGIKTTNVPMEVLMDLVFDNLLEKAMQD